MSLKKFDISYGFNGEPSTASLQFAYNVKNCAGQQKQSPEFFENSLSRFVSSGNAQVDKLIDGFVLQSFKKTKESGFDGVVCELVDRNARRLESIAVLVRGITAPPIIDTNQFKDFRRLYSSAEMGIGVGLYGDYRPVFIQNTAIIGRTFSIVNASYQNQSATLFYHQGQLVHQAPQGNLSNELIIELNNNAENASLKYGYYLRDAKELIELCGYRTKGFPSTNDFVIMDFGGSLKDVISSIAAFFGYYWTCNGVEIEFISSSKLLSMNVQNFLEDDNPNILSASYEKSLIGKSYASVIVGSSSNDNANDSFSFGDKSIHLNFWSVDHEKMFGESNNWVRAFLSFFRFSDNQEVFDKMIFIYMFTRPDGVFNAFFDKFYGKRPKEPIVTKKLNEIVSNSENQEELKEKHSILKLNPTLYSLTSTDGSQLEMPSKKPIYGVLKTACESVFGVYISRPVSEYIQKNYVVSSMNGLSVSGPYQGKTKLADVPELSVIYDTFKDVVDNPNIIPETILELYKVAHNGSQPLVNPSESYYFIGMKDFFSEIADHAQVKKSVDNFCTNGAGSAFNINGDNGYLALCEVEVEENNVVVQKNEKDLLADMVTKSREYYSQLKEKKDRTIRMKADKIKENESNTEVEGENLSRYNHEYKSFSIRPSSGSLSPVNILTFEGTVGEAEFLEENISSLLGDEFFPESSSATFSGLVLPDKDPSSGFYICVICWRFNRNKRCLFQQRVYRRSRESDHVSLYSE
jgi:hypothetical protein